MTLNEAFVIIWAFPWVVKGLLISPLFGLWIIWAMRPNLKDPADHFYYTFTAKLDRDLRKAYWGYANRINISTARENVIRNAHNTLKGVTGDHVDPINMPNHHRAAWAYLWKRTHEVLR